MKWIFLILLIRLVICFECRKCDENAAENGKYKINDEMNSKPLTNYRRPRTLNFESKEDESGIHLHFWNDMNNQENYYPNLMKYIAAESMQKDSSKSSQQTSVDESNSIHINLNELLPQPQPQPQPQSQPQPQVSPKIQLKNAFMQTLGDFRKSDQDLYGTYYKLNSDRYKQSPFSWNYHPSAINYIPKVYDTNLNNAAPIPMQSIPLASNTQRSTLYDQMHTTKNVIQNYYTNLHKSKPKNVIDAVGYEIGGLPKYSGRLLANEPMPQQYRTFKMFEPIPRQIMLPPPTTRIPEFKPVPPRLKIIPVIDEYLETHPSPIPVPIPMITPNSLPWQVIKQEEKSKPIYNYLYSVPKKSTQIIPFKLSEAITKSPPARIFIPKTEFNYIESSTESYYKMQKNNQLNSASINENISAKLATTSPKLNAIQINQKQTSINGIVHSQGSYESTNDPIWNNGYHNDSELQSYTNEHHPHEYVNRINNNIDAEPLNFDSTENSQSNLNIKKLMQQSNDNNIVKKKRKKVKILRKPSRTHEKITNDVIKLNVTGFRNVTKEENGMDNNSDSFDDNNNILKKESEVKKINKLGFHASNKYSIDSVSADSIQTSQTYSRHTTNIPQSTPSSLLKKDHDILLMQLKNDVKKALHTSLGNDTNGFANTKSDEMKSKDPFLIAVFDKNNPKNYDAEFRLSDDLQLAETDRSDMFLRLNDSNNTIQRIDHGWSDIRHKKWDYNSNHDSDNNHQNKINAKIMHYRNNVTTRIKPNELNGTFINDNYYKWFTRYAEENKKLGRTIISEHFKKVEIEPTISFVLPRKEFTSAKNQQENVDRPRRSAENETYPAMTAITV